jgi:uncharacterized protein (TIGR03382 family)
MPLKDHLQYQMESGSPTTVGKITLTPQSQVLSLRWPNGGWVWNRPVAVLVEKDGETERLPIVNVTRYAQVVFIAFTFAFAVLALLSQLGRRRRN